MERNSEREKSSRRERGSRDDDDHRRHHHRDRSKHHCDEENRHGSDDRRRKDRERSIERRSEREGSRDRGHDHDEESRYRSDDRRRDRGRSIERRSEREGSRDRAYDREDERRHRSDERRRDREREGSRDRGHDRERREKSRDRDRREKSYELEFNREESYKREDSVERRNSHKRKGRGESVDRSNGDEKRARVSEDKKEKRRVGDGELMDKEERRERSRFDNKVKEEEDVEIDEERKVKGFEMRTVKEEPKPEPGSIDTSVAMGSYNAASRTSPDKSLTCSDSPATKVPSISTTNENKGVNSNRSHEVLGKSSTDGAASDAGKSATLSIDAKGNAKGLIQRHKVLTEKLGKLRRIALLNKGAESTRDESSQMGYKDSVKATSTNVAVLPPPVASSNAGILLTPSSVRSTSTIATMASANMPPSSLTHVVGLTARNYEAVKRAQELSVKMGFRQDPEFPSLINMFPGQMPPEVTVHPKPAKAPVLRLDAFGREIDEQGNVVSVPKPSSTLKVNINKQKKESFQLLKPELDIDPDKNPHFDPRMGIDKNKILRPKKMSFQFVEEGKWSRDAEIIKLKSQFGELRAKELKAKQAQLAKAKAEPDINPNLIEVSERVITKEKPKEPIPDVEWWDAPVLRSGAYGGMVDGNLTDDMLKMEKITIYVEHPRPIEPPAEPAPPPPQPLRLTKKEQKKMRTRRRMDKEKEKQEMIRQGLLEPPKPKVKMSNLMKVLGSEATQDPTKLEKEIRSAAAEREQAHIDRNIARKLTPDERREKKERKLFDDPTITPETIVSVYRINDLSHPQNRFKVDVNAQENRMTGCAVISGDISVVVVEGGKKSIKRYGKLMLRRIDWAAAVEKEDDEDEDENKPLNKCVLVWQGTVAKSSFRRFFVHECRTEAAARKVFADAGVPHYWDLAVNFKDDEF